VVEEIAEADWLIADFAPVVTQAQAKNRLGSPVIRQMQIKSSASRLASSFFFMFPPGIRAAASARSTRPHA
jgi:hypothetical protein